MILNRLQKNLKKLIPLAKRQNIEAYRLYDKDIPEFPFLVDVYGGYVLVYDKSDPIKDKDKNHLPILLEAIHQSLGVASDKIVIKRRQRQEGKSQYEKMESRNEVFQIREGEAFFEVNLYDYLDTGLFLDHRPMRQKLLKDARTFQKTKQRSPKVLNLFCYTGSVSVCAALGGALVTSVDMSATYLDWARRNFAINNIATEAHVFVQENALAYLEKNTPEKFDIIFLDPPTFSNSKRMEDSFEVERDQDFIVNHAAKRLALDGVLYFSNNKRDFRLSEAIQGQYLVRDITEFSIPQDFHDKKIHRCFEIRHRG